MSVVRVGLLSLAGLVLGAALGVGLAVGLLWLTREDLRARTAPKVFEVEHFVIYLSVVLGGVLGAGFGAVCGALAGLASALRRRDTSP